MDPQGRHVTHPSLHIKTAHDAHVLFEAVRLGHLPMIRRRPSGRERAQLRSGDVFVWEEAAHKGGLERWTDGRKWSASRMREPFLFYEEKVARKGPYDYNSTSPLPSPSLTGIPSPSPFAHSSPNSSPSNSFQHFSHSADVGSGGLTKQTYSAWVTFPTPEGTIPENPNAYRKKWHLTAYFSSADYASLPSVQDDPLLQTICVPHGMYETGKGLMRKAPSKDSRPPPPSPVTYGEPGGGRYLMNGPYPYAPGPGPHPYLPPTAAAAPGHGHGHLRYVNEDDRDDAMSVDGDSYASGYPHRDRAVSASSSGGGYYSAGPPLPPPVPPYDSRHHYHYQHQPPHSHHAGHSSYGQHQQYYEQRHRHPSSPYDERDRERDYQYYSRAPRRYGSPGSPGSRSPGEDEHDVDIDEDEFDRDRGDDNDISRSQSGIASPPPLPRAHAYYRSSRRQEGSSPHSASSSPTSSSSSSARYYGGEAPGISRRSTVGGRTQPSMSLTLPPPPAVFLNQNAGESGSDGEMTPPGPILTPPISASSTNGTFPPGVHHHHSQNHVHGQRFRHASSTRREREREGDGYHGPLQHYPHYAHASADSPHAYYTPASIRTTASGVPGSASISNVRTGSGADRNGDPQEYSPYDLPPGSVSTFSGRAAATSSSPVTGVAKEASYPSPPPEGSGRSNQSEHELVPSIGALTSGKDGNGGNGGNHNAGNGMYRSAEDQKVLGAFRFAL